MESFHLWTFIMQKKCQISYKKLQEGKSHKQISELEIKSLFEKSFPLVILKGQTHRAHYFCDLKEDLLKELSFLRDVFVINGYPCYLVQQVTNKSWEKGQQKQSSMNIHCLKMIKRSWSIMIFCI